MKIILMLGFCAVFIFFIASCENLNDPGEIEYKNSVFFNLKTGSDEQKVYIYKSLPLEYEFNYSHGGFSYDHMAQEVFSSDAKISITGEDIKYTRFILKNDGDSLNMKKYFANEEYIIIRPSEKYKVNIESNGNHISGEIIATGEFSILNFIPEESGSDKYILSWSKAENARYYRIRILDYYSEWLPATGKISGVKEKSFILDPDTLQASNFYSRRIEIDHNYDSSRIVIEACDLNLYNYYIRKIKQSNIVNSYGFLGASTAREIVVR